MFRITNVTHNFLNISFFPGHFKKCQGQGLLDQRSSRRLRSVPEGGADLPAAIFSGISKPLNLYLVGPKKSPNSTMKSKAQAILRDKKQA